MESITPMPQFENFVREIAPKYGITKSELEAILLALEDYSGIEIAQKLNISEAAVRKRLGEGYRKFEIDGKSNKKLGHLKQKILEEFQSRQPCTAKQEPDWGEAIDVEDFRGRVEQIRELEHWILGRSRGDEPPDRARLVGILGLGGIGKTALAARLARSIAPEFEFVIWRSLRNAPPLEDILAELLRFLPSEPETDLPDNQNTRLLRLINALQEHRCLVVLDNVESILRSGKDQAYHQAGDYRKGYEGYGDLFKKVGETPHKSCLLLTSREKPKELAALEGKKLAVKVLQLSGVNIEEARNILDDKGWNCSDEQLNQLIKRYSGNTLALKIVSTTVYDLFGNNVKEFLSQIEQDTAVYGDIRTLLDGQFQRLSKLEQQVMYWLAINREYVLLSELKEDIITTESPMRLLEAVESLSRRSLIERDFASGKLRQPFVVLEYVTEQLIEQFCDEIINEKELEMFDAYPIIKARSLDYLRKMQEEQILEPVKNKLFNFYDRDLESYLRRMLDRVRNSPSPKKGYAAGNLINIMRQLQIDQPQIDLSGHDFSDLTIRQAYFKDVRLRNTKFINTDLTDSVFSETLASLVSVRFSPNGKFFATGVGDGEIRLWQVSDNKQIRIYKGHTAWVWTVIFSPDGKLLASGSGDHTVKLWRVDTGECIYTFRDHTHTVSSVSFSEDGQILASASEDQTIKLWNVKTGDCLNTLKGHEGWVWALNFSPIDDRLLASGSADGTIKLWDGDKGVCVKTLKGHTSQVYSVAFSPNGETLASSSEDQTVKLWNIQTGECDTLTGHQKKVHSVRFSPTGKILASSGEDRTIKLWDVETRKRLQNLKGHSSQVWSIAFSPDGQTLLSSSDDQTACLWDVKKGKLLNVLKGETRGIYAVAFAPHDFAANALDVPDRALLASGNDDHIVRLWNLQTRDCHDLRGHTGRIRSVAFSPTEPILASGSADHTIRLWNVHQRTCEQILEGHSNWVWTVRFSPDGQRLASSSEDRTIRLWDRRTGDCLQVFKGHTHWVWSVAFNAIGDTLASGSADSKVMVWDVETGECVRVLEGHRDLVWSVAFSPSQSILASSSEDRTIRLWDVQTGRCLRTLKGHQQQVYCVAFSPDGRSLVSGSADETIQRWDVETGKCLDTYRRGHTAPIRAVTFSADGQTIASGSEDETIQLWDVEKGTRRALKSDRLYEGMDITRISGLTDAQVASLKALGALNHATLNYAKMGGR
ncbi:MAG: Fis family transcriptional regulator [Leptolyngbyaceae cyanobacterium CSU_1_3]|nr:Fis family transcriptional regulator [Leptolyngbyaceae cyanobacterium CSU_1_3]